MPARSLRALALLAALAATPAGCAPNNDRPKTVPVQGKVTFKGEPVTKGTVTFQADSGQSAVGQIQPDGTYRLGSFEQNDGAIPGHYKVMIIANDADPTKIPGSSPGYKPPRDLVPRKYGSFETSGLEADVAEGKTAIDFELK
jgi:hypothetical protein